MSLQLRGQLVSVKLERIAKVIASLGICSRRAAEKLITGGDVKINNVVITNLAHKISITDQLAVNDKLIPRDHVSRLWRMYKPRGIITTHDDPQKRTSIIDILPNNVPNHIMTVGRLDLMTEGLILLTNDGELSRFLEHPSNGVTRIYRVKIFGKLNDHNLSVLKAGLNIDGIQYEPINCKIIKTLIANQWLEMELKEGKNREIRKIIAYFGCKVNKLVRIAYGPFSLGNLRPGNVQEVATEEIRNIIS